VIIIKLMVCPGSMRELAFSRAAKGVGILVGVPAPFRGGTGILTSAQHRIKLGCPLRVGKGDRHLVPERPSTNDQPFGRCPASHKRCLSPFPGSRKHVTKNAELFHQAGTSLTK